MTAGIAVWLAARRIWLLPASSIHEGGTLGDKRASLRIGKGRPVPSSKPFGLSAAAGKRGYPAPYALFDVDQLDAMGGRANADGRAFLLCTLWNNFFGVKHCNVTPKTPRHNQRCLSRFEFERAHERRFQESTSPPTP